jgi:hypothetical protein
MFSERLEPISELVKGEPEKPLREPALALFACLLNVYQIFQLSRQLSQLSTELPPDPWMGWYYSYLLGLNLGLIGFLIGFTAILIVGAAMTYFFRRRVGAVILLVSSIVGLLVGFVGMSIVVMNFNILGLVVNFLSPSLGLLAGIFGIRGGKPASREAVQEII